MKKFLSLLVICISSFIIYTNNVKADTYDTYNITNYSFTGNGSVESPTINYGFINGLWKPSSFYNRMTINFNNISTNNYDYFLLNFSIFNESYDVYTCSNEYVSGNEIADINITTTYGDGSTSSNNGTIEFSGASGMLRYCNAWKSIGEYYTLFISYNVNNNIYSCQTILDKNGSSYALCPIPKNINSFSLNNINFDTSFLQTKQNYYFKISQNIWFIKSNSSTLNSINNNTSEIKNDIKNDNTSGAESSADDLKNNSAFQDNTGLSGVISMPLTFVNSLTNTCQPINLIIPYMDADVSIPCMQPIITNKMPLLANLIKIVVNGFIVYRILLDIFQIVRNAKNPEDDRIEVLDL